MTIHVDLDRGEVVLDGTDGAGTYSLGSDEGFAAVSRAWLRSGWDAKYAYSFTWIRRPILQLPDDIIRIQELIYRIKPDVIVETGIAHGGSLVFYASLCKVMEKGRVIGIDVDIRPHNRKAIESHLLAPYLTLIEGDSVDPDVVATVARGVEPGETVMVLLDSKHTKAHVLAELEAYAPLVTRGSYIVAMDGIMGRLGKAPRTQADWAWNNPSEAVHEFVARHAEFALDEPPFLFNEGAVRHRVSYSPDAYLRKASD